MSVEGKQRPPTLEEFIFRLDSRRLWETPFPALDKSNYSDLSNFIGGQEMSFIRYLLPTDTRWLSNGGIS